MQIDFGGGGEISFERKGKAGLVKLTRSSALNALTHKMILALDRALQAGKPIRMSPVLFWKAKAGRSAPVATWLQPIRPDAKAHPLLIFPR